MLQRLLTALSPATGSPQPFSRQPLVQSGRIVPLTPHSPHNSPARLPTVTSAFTLFFCLLLEIEMIHLALILKHFCAFIIIFPSCYVFLPTPLFGGVSPTVTHLSPTSARAKGEEQGVADLYPTKSEIPIPKPHYARLSLQHLPH